MADYAKGQILRELRANSRMSREKVAAEIGVTTKTLYSWENDGGIKLDNAAKLASFYGIEDPESLIARSTDGGDQLQRLERMLQAVMDHLGISLEEDAGEELEREIAKAVEASGTSAGSSGVVGRVPRAASRRR